MAFDRKAYMKEYHKKDYKKNKQKIDYANKQYYQNHKDEITDYKKEWYDLNKDITLARQSSKYKKLTKEQRMNRGLKSNYGITINDYNKMFDEQNGCCAICGKHQSEFSKALHVDHDHITGKIRGLLCQKCNHGIGLFNDSVELLRIAASYLEKEQE